MRHYNAMSRVLKARENVARADRWFADIIYNVRLIENNDQPTMCTDGTTIYYNSKFVEENDVGTQIEGVFCHEGWHVILSHVPRAQKRNPRDWNIACDAIINPMVLRRGWALPAKHVRIPEVETQRMSAEKAYEWIRDKRQAADTARLKALAKAIQDGTVDQFDESKFPDGIPMPGSAEMIDLEEAMKGLTPEERKAIEGATKKIERAIETAMGKDPGRDSHDAEVRRHVRPDGSTRILDWRDIIRDMADRNRNMDTRTWSRPSRRHLWENKIMPGYMRDKVNRIVVCFDISGSITSNMEKVAEMKREIAGMLEEDVVTNAVVVSVDTAVRAIGEVDRPDAVLDFDLKIRNGGTDFSTAMDEVAQQKDCVGCVFLTDMMTSSFGKDPGFPVVWVNWGEQVRPGGSYYPPYGRVIDFKQNQQP